MSGKESVLTLNQAFQLVGIGILVTTTLSTGSHFSDQTNIKCVKSVKPTQMYKVQTLPATLWQLLNMRLSLFPSYNHHKSGLRTKSPTHWADSRDFSGQSESLRLWSVWCEQQRWTVLRLSYAFWLIPHVGMATIPVWCVTKAKCSENPPDLMVQNSTHYWM